MTEVIETLMSFSPLWGAIAFGCWQHSFAAGLFMSMFFMVFKDR